MNTTKANPQSFQEYFDEHIAYIESIETILSKSLSDDPVIMDEQAREAECQKVPMRKILSYANDYLDVAEEEQLKKIGPRRKDMTDLDRQVSLAAAVHRERRFRDICRGICDSLEGRISYVQTHLRTFSQAEGQRYSHV